MMGATALLRRQVVTVCNVVQGDADVSSPVTSAEEPDKAFSVTLSLVGSAHYCTKWYGVSSCISYTET